MTVRTIHVFDRTSISVRDLAGGLPRNGDVIANALNGDAFSWEVPNDLVLNFPAATTALSFDDADGLLSDDPYAGETVTDQRLTQAVSIGGRNFLPSDGSVRWQSNAPVTVENEYEVTLYDAAGASYRMVGVSITTGYSTTVVGVMFDGAAPAAGVSLYYRQGLSSYSGAGQTVGLSGSVNCFLAGTLIDTPLGLRRVEDLRIGDQVTTLDHGPRTLRWIGQSRIAGRGPMAPVRVAAGAIGNRRDLFVSPNHRILMRASQAELFFGTPEVLVAARHLVNGRDIHPAPRDWAAYVHLLLDRHEMLFSEGVASETLDNGPAAQAHLSAAARAELMAVYPRYFRSRYRLCRRSLSASESRLILPDARAVTDGQGRAPAHDYSDLVA